MIKQQVCAVFAFVFAGFDRVFFQIDIFFIGVGDDQFLFFVHIDDIADRTVFAAVFAFLISCHDEVSDMADLSRIGVYFCAS